MGDISYRFTLSYNGVDTILEDYEQPNNFGSVQSVIKRDFKTHGTFYRFTDGSLKLEFYGQGRTILKTAFTTEGLDAVVTLTVERKKNLETSFTEIYTGQANFANYELRQDSVNVDFEEVSTLTKIMGRSKVNYDTSKTVNLEGGAITPDLTSFNFEGLIIKKRASLGIAEASLFTFDYPSLVATGSTTSTQTNRLVDSGADFSNDPAVEIGSRVDNSTDGTKAFITAISPTTLTIDSDIFTSGESYSIRPKYTLSSIVKSDPFVSEGYDEINFSDGTDSSLLIGEPNDTASSNELLSITDNSGDKVFFLNLNSGFELKREPSIGSYSVSLNVQIRFDVTVGNAARYAIIEYTQLRDGSEFISNIEFGSYVTAGAGIVEQNDDYTINVSDSDKRIVIGLTSQTGGDSTVLLYALTTQPEDFTDASFFANIEWNSDYPDTTISGQLIHEAVDKNLEYITGEQNLLYSELFGRTDLYYDADGAGAFFLETNGYKIRGNTRGIVMSLQDRLNSLNSIFCIGHGLQLTDNNKTQFEYRVEIAEYFYQDVEMASFDSYKDGSYSESYFDGLKFNIVEVGYSKFGKEEGLPASYLDYCTKQQYNLPTNLMIPDIEPDRGQYKIVSNYIASPFLWEETRRKRFNSDPTTTSDYDKDVFIIQGISGSIVYNIVSWSEGTGANAGKAQLELSSDLFNTGDVLTIEGCGQALYNVTTAILDELAGNIYVMDIAYNNSPVVTGTVKEFPELSLRALKTTDSVENITSEEDTFTDATVVNTYFNWLICARYNIFNHSSIISSAMYKKDGNQIIKNTETELFEDLSFSQISSAGDNFGDVGTAKYIDSNVTKSQLMIENNLRNGDALFDPIVIKFEVGMTKEQASDIFLGHRNGLNDGTNYGYISIVDPDGETKYGWLLELKYNPVDEIGSFELLKKLEPPASGLMQTPEGDNIQTEEGINLEFI